MSRWSRRASLSELRKPKKDWRRPGSSGAMTNSRPEHVTDRHFVSRDPPSVAEVGRAGREIGSSLQENTAEPAPSKLDQVTKTHSCRRRDSRVALRPNSQCSCANLRTKVTSWPSFHCGRRGSRAGNDWEHWVGGLPDSPNPGALPRVVWTLQGTAQYQQCKPLPDHPDQWCVTSPTMSLRVPPVRSLPRFFGWLEEEWLAPLLTPQHRKSVSSEQ